MDSPESSTAKVNATTAVKTSSSSNSPSVQESPFSHFLSSFSPLNFDNSSRSSHVFLGLNSPPLIFTTPRANPVHETGLVISEGNTQTSKGKETQENEKENKGSHESVKWDKSAIDLDACLPISSRATAADNDEQVQGCGSSERVDKYLANSLDSSGCSDHTVEQKLMQLRHVLEVSPISADIPAGSLKVVPDSEKETLTEGRVEEDVKEQGMLGDGEGAGQEDEINVEGKCKYCSNELHDKCRCLDTQSEMVRCGEESKFPSEHPSKNMETVHALEDSNNNVELCLSKSNNNVVLEPEGNQQRGMSRRCLQFEEAQPKANSKANISMAVTAFLGHVDASSESDRFDSNTSSCSRHLINASPTTTDVSCSANNVEQFAPPSKPFGIGVHLNTIVKTAPFHHAANASMKPSDCSMSVLEIRSKVMVGISPVETSNEEFLQDPEDFKSLQILDDLASPSGKRKFSPEDPIDFEKLNQLSPKKKKKLPSSPEDDANKRCNCKKTKCLKLYCDCFAAGIYCDESCSCQGCLNKPEHAETVLQTRQQIESRNPLAFAPKIIQHGFDFSMSNMETGTLTTPASARHKRGCNCKKSLCLKKYCECYQGGVGCSSGCRCENCKNIYGKKNDYVAEEFLSGRPPTERSKDSKPDGRMDLPVVRKSLLESETYHMHKLSPVTPSFQQSDHGKGAPKSQIIIRRYKPSPESDLRLHRNSDGNNSNPEPGLEVTETSSYDHDTRQINPEMAKGYTSSRLGQLGTSPTHDSGSGILNNIEDGDTHEMLTDASTPIKPVKVCSPSRKRVSPPQRCLSETGSSSSGPLRSGRKFILKALPPFPPLTPCLENKGLASQKPDDNPQTGE